MALVRKGSRRIDVDGVTYRWRVRRKPTYEQGLCRSPLTYAVERADIAGSALIVTTALLHPNNWFGQPSTSVRPADVANQTLKKEVALVRSTDDAERANGAATPDTTHRFTGQVFDYDTGLYYYGARYYDPELARFVEAFPVIRVSAPGVDVVEVREDLNRRWQRMTPVVQVGEVTDLTTPVPVRVYKPVRGAVGLPVVVFTHGGGWCTGGLVTHDDLCRRICRSAQAIVVAVDYRLAPEHPFPAAVDDSFAVLRWVGEHAAEIGGDPTRIAVAGDSAGGNLATVVHQKDVEVSFGKNLKKRYKIRVPASK